MTQELLSRYDLRPKRPEVIDSSMLKTYADCPSRFYLRYVLGLKRISRDPSDDAKFDWGTTWHRLMETWWGTHDFNAALEQLEPWPISVQPETDRHGRSKPRMEKIFTEYVKKYGVKDLEAFEILRGEQYFDVYNEEQDLRWCGRTDQILRRKRNGAVVVLDHKTTSAMGKNYWPQYEHSFQLPGYVWAMNQIFTEPIHELLLDVVYTLKASHEFFRRTFRYTPANFAEWTTNVKMYVDEINYMLDKHLYEPSAWKKNWNECTRYGTCQFSDVHFLVPSGDSRMRVLANDYIEDRWDPRRLEDDKD